MVIYVDVLIFTNAVVDFLLISTVSVFIKQTLKFWRKLVASIAAAMFSLYIFLPPLGLAVQILMMVCSSVVTVLIAFGYGYFKKFIRCTFMFYCATFLFGGLMTGVYLLFKPQKMSINNGVIYFDISPLVLITVSMVIYILLWIFKRLTKRDADFAVRCIAEITVNNISLIKTAMVDTGHTLQDGFSGNTVVIIDKKTAVELIDNENVERMLLFNPPDSALGLGFRLIPANTASGEGLLPAFVLDCIKITINKRTVNIHKPIAVISKSDFREDYSVIIPPEAVD